MIDSLKRIRETEKQATDRIEQAKKESGALLSKTETDAKALIAKAEEDARQKAADMMKTACADAEGEAGKIIQDGMQESQTVRESGEGRVGAATKIIVTQIAGEA